MIEQTSLYERVGGMSFFERLVAGFYQRVATDEILRPLYPEEDLVPAQHRLTLFLAQYWGGPRAYEHERGHPRLRMRHVPFAIGTPARDRWLLHMRASLAELSQDTPIPLAAALELDRYLEMAAEAMRNRE